MSEPEKHPDETREQFVTKPTGETLLDLESQRLALGFLSSNALGLVVLHEFAKVPPAKFWDALAKVRAFDRAPAAPAAKKSGFRIGGKR